MIAVIDWIIVAIVGIFGIKISYTDIKYSKVYNKDLLQLLIICLTLILIKQSLVHTYANIFLDHLFFGLLGLLTGYLFWLGGLWAPADGKLFAILSFIIPQRFLRVSNSGTILSFLSNIFVIIALSVLINNLKDLKKDDFKQFSKMITPKMLLTSFIGVFGISYAMSMFFSYFKIPSNIFTSVLFLLIIMTILKKIFKANFMVLIIILAVIRLIFDYPNYLSLNTFLNLIQIFILYVLLRIFFLGILYNKNIEKKSVDELSVGDYLGEIPVMKKDNKIEFTKLNFFSLYNYFSSTFNLEDSKPVIDYDKAIGIEEENIDKIKEIYKQNHKEEVVVFKTMPFAPFLFIGFMITVVSFGDAFLLLGIFIKSFFAYVI